MASPPRSPTIPDHVLRTYEEQCITGPLLVALLKLQNQREAIDNTEVPFKRVPCNETPEPSWGRQSPQLTPTPSPSPSPKTSHRQLQSFPTPPDTSPLRKDPASASPNKPAAARRRPRQQQVSQTPKQPFHTMLLRSRARMGRAQERRFFELDASGRRRRRIVE